MHTRSILAAVAVALLAAGQLTTPAHARQQGKAPARAKPPAGARAPAAQPGAESLPVPKKATAQVVMRDAAGKEVQRLAADSTSAQTKVICAYASKDPMPDTLAFAIGVEEKWQLAGQIKDAVKKPQIQEVALQMASEPRSVMSWTGGAEACSLGKSTIDKNGNAELTITCRGVGKGLGTPLSLEARLDMDQCPKM